MEELPAAKKKKKSKHLELYSALNAKGPSAPVPVLSQTRALHSNAARWNETLTPKTFLVKKKKKKGISILKKKILLERLRVHIKRKLEASLAERAEAAAANQGGEYNIRVYNFADDVDLSDEDETKEVCSDLKELLLPAGQIRRIRILADPTIDTSERSAYVEVAFCSEQSARAAADSINGLVCGGRPVVATSGATDTSHTNVHTKADLPAEGLPIPDEHTGSLAGSISVYNMVSEESAGDPEEVKEILSDTREICAAYGRVQSIALYRVPRGMEHAPAAAPPKTMYENNDGEGGAMEASDLPWACVLFATVEAASAAVTALHGRVVGGSEVSAHIYSYSAYQTGVYADRHLLSPPDCLDKGCSRALAVRWRRFATAEEVQNEDERMELLSNLSAIVQGGGIELALNRAWFVQQQTVAMTEEDRADEADVDVILPVSSLQQASAMREHLSAQRVAGSVLCADIIALDFETVSAQVNNSLLSRYSDTEDAIFSDGGDLVGRVSCLCSRTGAAVVVVKNFFSEEDLEDSEDLAQLKADLLELCWDAPGIPGGVVRVHTVRGSHLAEEEIEDVPIEEESALESMVVVVTFARREDALEAMLHLDERVVGGDTLRVLMEDTSAYDAEVLISQDFPASGGAALHQSILAGSEECGTPGQGQQHELECVYEEEFAVADIQPRAVIESGLDATTESRGVGGSKYVEAGALPKLDWHDQPNLPIPVADELTNAAAKELLRLISTFQARMKEKNPQKAKQKLRFVAGLKQCTNSVKAGKVRVLLLAPNTEANEVVDDKIDSLIEEARRRNVPVCYCLSKRILGKALQLSMKQSAVAVLDPDGAYEHFKIILKFINPRDATT